MNLQNRIDLVVELGEYIKQNAEEWRQAKKQAGLKNPWFTENFIDTASKNICENFLEKALLKKWARHYFLDDLIHPKNIGVVMAGNIPMVGFHDFLSIFISGHQQTIKLSSKDDVLLKHLINKLYELNPSTKRLIHISETLKGCDAYIATGSNQSAQYFEQYFSKYPHIIRSNKTSVAILNGEEKIEELELLSDDIHLYFGLGCRNVTKLYVPKEYDFVPLLRSFDKFKYFRENQKYSNNYDYRLSILLLNHSFYMTNESTLLTEQEQLFSAIGVVHYEFYTDLENIKNSLAENPDIQCIVGKNNVPFGKGQQPGLFDYADGVDTMQFLLSV